MKWNDGPSDLGEAWAKQSAEIARLKAENEAMSRNLDDWLDLRRRVIAFVESRQYAHPPWKRDAAVKPLFDYVDARSRHPEEP